MQSALAVELPTPTANPKPEFIKTLNLEQAKALANREIQCQKCEADLRLTKAAYEDAIKAPKQNEAWWADPKIVIGGFVVTASVTALLTYVVVKETNK